MSDTPSELTPEPTSPESKPKKRIVRKTKSPGAVQADIPSGDVSGTPETTSSPTPRKRVMRKKISAEESPRTEGLPVPAKKAVTRQPVAQAPLPESPSSEAPPLKAKRGRPRKNPEISPAPSPAPVEEKTDRPPVRTRRVKESPGEQLPVVSPQTDSAEDRRQDEGRPKVIRQRFVRNPAPSPGESQGEFTPPLIRVVQESSRDLSGDDTRRQPRGQDQGRPRFDKQNRRNNNNNERFNKNRPNRPDNGNRQDNNRQDNRQDFRQDNRNGNNKNGADRFKTRRNNNNPQEPSSPQYHTPRDLSPPEEVDGLLELTPKGFGFLRKPDNDFDAFAESVYVPQDMIRKFGLRPAVWIRGQACRHERGILLTEIESVNGEPADKARKNPHFDELKAVNPSKRINFETRPERYTTRTLDLIAPVARGQRGLIVSPPRAGKTTLLQHMAEAILENHRDSIHLMVLLVDERPEEVTEFKRSLPGAEVYASSNDGRVRDHCRMAELCIERAKRLVEAGKHVFLLMDSITRLARAYNNADKGSGRTMSGGIDARALEMPRRLFAAARNTREAGSLTIIATALVETNSRMDDLIFQEFKGTGNMELVLNRRIAEQYIFPAVDILKSGTRREELIMPEAWLYKMNLIRRALAGHKPVEAMERFLFFLNKYPSNVQMLLDLKQKG